MTTLHRISRLPLLPLLALSLLGPTGAIGADRTMAAGASERGVRFERSSPRLSRRAVEAERAPASAPKQSKTAKAVATAASRPEGPNGLAAAGQPNLVVELFTNKSLPEGLPGTGFCVKPAGGGVSQQIRLRVRNEGTELAPASTTRIHWSSGAQDLATPPVSPGSARNLYVSIPDACWPHTAHGTCAFLVEVDRQDVVAETEENDNYLDGDCMLPGT